VIDTIYTLDEVEDVAQQILESCLASKIFTFTGDLGAGKTTLIKALTQKIGYNDEVSSPTFAIINEYDTASEKIYHMDLYRIKNEEELYDIGFEDYLYSGHYCFIEWPRIAESFFIEPRYDIHIEHKGEEKRRIRIEKG